MTYTFYEPLSAVDAAFLAVEDSRAHMHIGSCSMFDAAPLTRPEGGLDIARIRSFVESQLFRFPRFRQHLAYVPVTGAPVWVDAANFNLVYHVRHTALPFPGDERKLKDLMGRIMSQHLDRSKPLWEMWFVEGLEGGRFALLSKIHHALADGISGVDLMSALIVPDPQYQPEPAPTWMPRQPPGGWEMLSDQAVRGVTLPLKALVEAALSREAAPSPRQRAGAFSHESGSGDATSTPDTSRSSIGKLLGAAAAAIATTDPTPINIDIGPYRRFDWTKVDFGTIREIRTALGGKMNDIVLCVVSGAVGKFLKRRGVNVRGLDFNAMVPVSLRQAGEKDSLGNRITQILTRLPVDVPDPLLRLERVIEITSQLKHSGQAEGGEAFTALIEYLAAPVAAALARSASRHSFGNMVVTNVPGPATPTYFLGAQLLEAYPLVPLAPTQALNVAVLSYNKMLHWGINADWDAVPDLADFTALIDAEIATLTRIARAKAAQARAAAEPTASAESLAEGVTEIS